MAPHIYRSLWHCSKPHTNRLVSTLLVLQPRFGHTLYRGAILNMTYGTHENLHVSLFFTHKIWSYLLGYPTILIL